VRYWQRVCGQVKQMLARPASTSRPVSRPLPSASSWSYVRRRLASRPRTKLEKRSYLRARLSACQACHKHRNFLPGTCVLLRLWLT